ncbi:Uncharacterised protein [uncultured archaeon]|nr:Uncharacterised protein [uncultured archaeon]
MNIVLFKWKIATLRKIDHRIMAVVVGFFLFLLVFEVAVSVTPATASSLCNPLPHEPILITSDNDFTHTNGVVSGTGTASDPYLISNWQIKNLTPGYAIKVDNSEGEITKFFKIGCIQSNFAQVPATGAKLIWLVNIHTPTTISDVAGNSRDAFGVIGIQLDLSGNISLDRLSLNRIGDHGILLNSSDHINIIRSKLKADGDGVLMQNSHHITIGSQCNLATGTDCNAFTYDDGRGIWINNSHDVLVQYTITSADDSGGIVIDGNESYNVTLINGIAAGNGPICRMDPETGIRKPTGLRIDFISGIAIINGAHDISVKDYNIHGNAHYDIMNGGDGNYLNRCTGIVEHISKTLPGGANIDLNGNCYGTQSGFSPTPTKNCPKP